ncbi:MAG: hypothetical protein HYW62_01655 [Candidatus Levybacteria bacterium]|nr:hypothetical protein [Candidatus Levybacteria bacterium]
MKTLFTVLVIIFFNFQFSIFPLRSEASNFQFSKKAFAEEPCQAIYGGGTTCIKTQDITVDSKVLNPDTNKMVDNLGPNDAKYQSDFIVTFQVLITNNRKTVIEKAHIQDIFPQFVSFSSGPGSFDSTTRTLAFDADNLMPSETRTFNIFGRIVDTNQLSFSENVICLVNQVKAFVPDPAVGQDNSQFCIEKKSTTPAKIIKQGFPVLSPVPIKTAPPTGPESLILFSLIPTGILGWILRKKSKQPLSL